MNKFAKTTLFFITAVLGGCVTQPNRTYDPTPNVTNDTAGHQVCSSSGGNAANCALIIGSTYVESTLHK